jgi:hypothetical protein
MSLSNQNAFLDYIVFTDPKDFKPGKACGIIAGDHKNYSRLSDEEKIKVDDMIEDEVEQIQLGNK